MEIHPDELSIIINAHLDEYGPSSHHLSSFNRMASVGLPQIITSIFQVECSLQPLDQPEIKNISVIIYIMLFTRLH